MVPVPSSEIKIAVSIAYFSFLIGRRGRGPSPPVSVTKFRCSEKKKGPNPTIIEQMATFPLQGLLHKTGPLRALVTGHSGQPMRCKYVCGRAYPRALTWAKRKRANRASLVGAECRLGPQMRRLTKDEGLRDGGRILEKCGFPPNFGLT